MPILTYDDFPMYMPGLSHFEALDRFRVRFTGYVKNNVNFIPFEVDTRVFPVPPYPEVEYPYFPVDNLPFYYTQAFLDDPIDIPQTSEEWVELTNNVKKLYDEDGRLAIFFNVLVPV